MCISNLIAWGKKIIWIIWIPRSESILTNSESTVFISNRNRSNANWPSHLSQPTWASTSRFFAWLGSWSIGSALNHRIVQIIENWSQRRKYCCLSIKRASATSDWPLCWWLIVWIIRRNCSRGEKFREQSSCKSLISTFRAHINKSWRNKGSFWNKHPLQIAIAPTICWLPTRL